MRPLLRAFRASGRLRVSTRTAPSSFDQQVVAHPAPLPRLNAANDKS